MQQTCTRIALFAYNYIHLPDNNSKRDSRATPGPINHQRAVCAFVARVSIHDVEPFSRTTRTHLLDPLENTVLFRVIGMVLGGNLEQGRERLRVLVDDGANLFGNVLVDEEDGNVFAFLREAFEVGLEVGR